MAPLPWVKDDTEVDSELKVAYEIEVLVVTMVSGVNVDDGLWLEDSDEAVELVIEDSVDADDILDEARLHEWEGVRS
jgi:hypothetical protein